MQQHFLITRFNLKTEVWQNDKKGDKVLTASWLEERFRLFEDYCLPSVKNQSNQNFKWCVFFDTDTPALYKNRIAEIASAFPNFIPVYIDGMKFLNRAIINYIAESLTPESKFIITSRLDNDDIIHKDFVNIIQNEFPLAANMVIDLQKGYQVAVIGKATQIRTIDFPFNQFVSYVEAVDKPIKTVLSKMHRDWKNNEKVAVYTEKELWVELIHDSNMSNSIRGQFKRSFGFNNSDFGLSGNLIFKEKLFSVLWTNWIMDLKRLKSKILKKVKS